MQCLTEKEARAAIGLLVAYGYDTSLSEEERKAYLKAADLLRKYETS